MSTSAIRSPGTDQGSVAYLTFLSIISALGGLLFGFDTVVISGTLTPLKAQFALSPAVEGWLVSSALLGCAVGAALAGSFSDRCGRKPALLLSGWLFIICSVGCALAWDVNALIWSRLIGGLGVGLASMVSPLYISEISAPRLRGRMVTLFQFAITIGICLALLSNAWLQSLSAQQGGSGFYRWLVVEQVWRAMFGMEIFPSVVFTALCLLIPETPRFLTKRGRIEEARTILTRVGGSAVAEKELVEIRAALAEESGSVRQLFQPGLRRALFVALFLAIVSELSGITVVLYYGPGILEKAGFSLGEALGGFVSIGLVNVLFTIVAIWLMDAAGRRPLLFWGNAGAFLSLSAISYLFYTKHTEGLLLVGMMCLFVACFAFSMGPIKWVVMSEIFPTRIRGRAMAIATLAVWVTDGVYNQLFPMVRERLGVPGSFCIFAAVLVPQFFFIWKVMPETKGRTLEQIESSWR
ncbi:MAG: sugar porter family MFS transporter [Acidobacteria bacterium]|nr:sugar porter family MFS transporter [Acidobacteriota bacterium]